MGYKGRSHMDSGYFYAPYLSLEHEPKRKKRMGLILVIFILLLITGTIHLSGVLTVGAFALLIPLLMGFFAISLVLAIIRHLFTGPDNYPPNDNFPDQTF